MTLEHARLTRGAEDGKRLLDALSVSLIEFSFRGTSFCCGNARLVQIELVQNAPQRLVADSPLVAQIDGRATLKLDQLTCNSIVELCVLRGCAVLVRSLTTERAQSRSIVLRNVVVNVGKRTRILLAKILQSVEGTFEDLPARFEFLLIAAPIPPGRE